MTAPSAVRYRCYGYLGTDGRWCPWRFAPATRAEFEKARALAAERRQILFLSVQVFAPPIGAAGDLRWTQVSDQYRGEGARAHGAPLYFDIDAEGDLEKALVLARYLAGFFRDDLGLPPCDVRTWFSGAKGVHLLVNPLALGIEPSATLTADMKAAALGLVRRLETHGAPDLGTDPAVYSLPRMLRAPDQLHPKSGLWKVELAPEELFRLSAGEITGLARSPRGPVWEDGRRSTAPVPMAAAWWAAQVDTARRGRAFRRRTAELAGVKLRPDGYVVDELLGAAMPACVGEMARSVVAPGSRNRCELQLACWAKGAGRGADEALDLLATWTGRNRPELSPASALRKAESIARTVYGGSHYGFSCGASRAVARAVGLEVDCAGCKAVRRRPLKQLASLREGEDGAWVPPRRITLEDARGRIARSLERFFACAQAARRAREDAAGHGQDAPGPEPARRDAGKGRLRRSDP
ncbi:MAG: hypothetical protein AMK72_11880 [Planctomycetes bacterium SM23_25]|nr:MAG: hypothetical protein AMK72_11880 [Planctomycetes bacterium SM23_25]